MLVINIILFRYNYQNMIVPLLGFCKYLKYLFEGKLLLNRTTYFLNLLKLYIYIFSI